MHKSNSKPVMIGTNNNIQNNPLSRQINPKNCIYTALLAYLSTSSCKHTTDLRLSPSPTEKLHNSEKSSTVLWIKNRWYEDTGGNISTLKINFIRFYTTRICIYNLVRTMVFNFWFTYCYGFLNVLTKQYNNHTNRNNITKMMTYFTRNW